MLESRSRILKHSLLSQTPLARFTPVTTFTQLSLLSPPFLHLNFCRPRLDHVPLLHQLAAQSIDQSFIHNAFHLLTCLLHFAFAMAGTCCSVALCQSSLYLPTLVLRSRESCLSMVNATRFASSQCDERPITFHSLRRLHSLYVKLGPDVQ